MVTRRADTAPQWALIAVIAFTLAVDYLVYGVIIPLTPVAPPGITRDEQVVILTAAYGVGTLVATPVFGYLGDRFGCRRLIIGGALVLGVTTVLLAWAPTFGVMLAARMLQGVSAAATWTSGLALVAERYAQDRVRMMGFALMGSTSGSVLGPLSAGGLHAVGGYRLPLLVMLVFIAVDVALLVLFVPVDARDRRPDATVFSLLDDRAVIVPAVAVVFAAAAWTIIESLVPFHAASGGADPARIGVMFTVTTLIYGLSAPVVMWTATRIGIRRTSVLGAVVMALSMPLIGLSANIFAIAGATALVQVAYAFLLNPQSAAMGDAVESRGLQSYCAVYSVFNVSYTVGTIGIALLVSATLQYLSLSTVLWCVGGVLMLCTVILLAVRAPARQLNSH